MLFSKLALAVFAATVSAQTLGTLPTCAQSCVTAASSGSNIGNCQSGDVACICSSQSFLSGIACCLQNVCSAADITASIDFAKQICITAGVTVPNSTEALCAANASSSGASKVAASTSLPASAASSAAVVATATSSGTTLATSRANSTTSGVAASSGAATASAATTSPSSAAHAQQMVESGAVALVGGIVAFFALLY